MRIAELRELRLRVQGLRAPFDATAPEVVRRFVAVQSQEFLPAQFGLAVRVPSERRPDAAAVAAQVDAGEILRTHVLRPTWHFLHPADARWVLELSAERVHRVNATYYRRTGVDGETATRGLDLIAQSLAGGHRTRSQLAAALDSSGLPHTGLAFTYLLMLAELERVAISGADVGKQRTYAAFDDRVPAAEPRPRDEALAELAARFIASRGPVTDRDFAAWSGFTLGDTRQAFADATDGAAAHGARLEQVDVDGVTHVLDAEAVAAASARSDDGDAAREAETGPVVDLLQAYDEYIMGYAVPRMHLLPPGRSNPVHAEFPLHALMIDGVMAGRWAPVVQGRKATVRIVPWRPFTRDEERSLAASVAEVERFLGVPAAIERAEPAAPE
ncbi:winged helix DNA-binding domain-containing protein [Agromyces sp. Marseille-P2726]|uniref:winged helix DNA-binding domain-containing protein n=1 Tax=Agromyces sp. Marseille-P2726 TaxID=2709132 RepID=UPI0015710915|nr:winged helix DNA-binding domain-containing protein [Agromyces sp. Marseille-P2726]